MTDPQVVHLTVNKSKLDEFSMVFLNNLLSLPLILFLMYFYGELPSVVDDPALRVSSSTPHRCGPCLLCRPPWSLSLLSTSHILAAFRTRTL